MEPALASLVKELTTLRKGRGLFVRQIGERVGPDLRGVCNVLEIDGPAEIRRKVAERLEGLATSLPEDLRIAILAAFALHPEARLPFFQERVRWTAQRLNRDDRTARRRIDEAIERLAELAVSANNDTESVGAPDSGWHTDELRISLVLDQPAPEAFESRRIVADRDGVQELDLAMTLTMARDRGEPISPDELRLDVFYGGRLIEKRIESTDRLGLVLELPQPLNRGSTHDFALRHRILRGRMQPHYVCVPKRRCDLFDLHVRFDLTSPPARIWRLSDAFQRDVDYPGPSAQILTPDAAGEVHMTFRRLTPGLAYGARWAPPDPWERGEKEFPARQTG